MPEDFDDLESKWRADWDASLKLWSPFTRLKAPIFCRTEERELEEGLTGSFAMIRLNDHAVVVSLRQVAELGLHEFSREVLAHEIGHHIVSPGDLADWARMHARMRPALVRVEEAIPTICNLYADLLINDRLFREHELRLDRIYRKLPASESKLWNFYMRVYELLWAIKAGTLANLSILTDEIEGDARLGYSLVRAYSRQPLKGCGKFAALCYPYLIDERTQTPKVDRTAFGPILDTENASKGRTVPPGLTERDDDEIAQAIHPALEGDPPAPAGESPPGGNHRQPLEYGQILKSLNVELSDLEIAARYYKERALGSLVAFPKAPAPRSKESVPEGVTTWDIGTPIQEIRWLETALRSPVPIPGYTIVESVWGEDRGNDRAREPVDLDLYLDCSGSMPDPVVQVSYLTLAGAIVALSALRAGSSVQATLWSGPNQVESTGAFVRSERDVLRILCGYFGGGTAFPLHVLRRTYENRKPTDRKVHILVVSDDGVTTMFDNDERGTPGERIARTAIERSAGGATMVLNLARKWETVPSLPEAAKMGWTIFPVSSWESLVEFGRAFARKHYQEGL